MNSVYDVYDAAALNSLYQPNKHNERWNYESSPEQDFLFSCVAHEHAIFKRHTKNVLKIVGPFVAYACYTQFPYFKELSLFIRMPFALFVGYFGGEMIGEGLCEVYKHLCLAIGRFISNDYDPYGHSEFLSENKPYLSEPGLRLSYVAYCIIFILLVKSMIGI